MFRKVLIANRGEIAVRIAKTLQQMQIKAVMLHWKGDENSTFLNFADEISSHESASPRELYLSIEKIIEAAKEHNVDAIHPGYGFLAENPRFAEACEKAKIVFIGPTPKVLKISGDKLSAKKNLEKLKVPFIPSAEVSPSENESEIKKKANKIGYPILVKAAGGGGGKGMRLVRGEGNLISECQSASDEAQSAFGDPRIFFEHYLEKPHHIEVQIVGDHHSHLIDLFERECSIQRRYQKIIEESPSPSISKDLREKIIQAALKIAKAIGYTNAGTFEFLTDDRGNFYFLEINPRIQVEHPVTEMVTGIDLIRTQILVAAGEKLSQNDISARGHAIECRINAEDPKQNFFPSTGPLHVYLPPHASNIRVDSGSSAGDKITIHYDPLVAKVIVWDETRERAIQKMLWAINHFPILGVKTNAEFLKNIVMHPDFIAGKTHTHFIEDHQPELISEPAPESIAAAALASLSEEKASLSQSSYRDPWETF